MNSKEIIKYLKNSIDEKGNYCYSLPVETTKATIKEIKRLNNIINELEKWVKEDSICFETQFYMGRCVNYQCILDKLQELKGSNK